MYKASAFAVLLSLVRTSASHSGCRGGDDLFGVDSKLPAAASWAWDGDCVNLWSTPPFVDTVILEEQAADESWRAVDAIAIYPTDGRGWLCVPFRGVAAQLPLRLRFVDEDEDTACPDLFEQLLQKKRHLADAGSSAPTPAPTPAPTMSPTYSYPASAAPTFATWAPSPAPTYAAKTWAPTAAPTTFWVSFSPTPAPSTAAASFAPTPASTYLDTWSPTPAPTYLDTWSPTPAPTPAPTYLDTWSPTPAPRYLDTRSPTPAPFATFTPTTADLTPIPVAAATPMPTPVQEVPPVGGNRRRSLYEDLYAEEEEEWIAVAAAGGQQQLLLPASWRIRASKQVGDSRRVREEQSFG